MKYPRWKHCITFRFSLEECTVSFLFFLSWFRKSFRISELVKRNNKCVSNRQVKIYFKRRILFKYPWFPVLCFVHSFDQHLVNERFFYHIYSIQFNNIAFFYCCKKQECLFAYLVTYIVVEVQCDRFVWFFPFVTSDTIHNNE